MSAFWDDLDPDDALTPEEARIIINADHYPEAILEFLFGEDDD